MIPKIIHYCWFGQKRKPRLIEKCIKSWKEMLSEYTFIEWNENTFDIMSNSWTKEAYAQKKYAFVADYVRLFALSHHGGIYLDTDVQVLKNFNSYLKYSSFVSFEGTSLVGTAVIGAELNSQLIKEFLNFYRITEITDKTFCAALMNTAILRDIYKNKGLIFNNTHQSFGSYGEVFPFEIFSAKILKRDEYHITNDTICIHHFTMSWFSWHSRVRIKIANITIKPIRRLFGILPPKYNNT